MLGCTQKNLQTQLEITILVLITLQTIAIDLISRIYISILMFHNISQKFPLL